MNITINKYQGAGNDFIIIDNRNGLINPADYKLIRWMCDRRFGIGADGVILISDTEGYSYKMTYFNADGFEGTMCGNGGRCTAAFAISSGIAPADHIFGAIDAPHRAIEHKGLIRLSMNDVNSTEIINGNYFINTGSPHYVLFVKDVAGLDVYSEGKKLRWAPEFAPGGTNVNFAEIRADDIFVRTFERGVEDETLSCGTGVTASAIAAVLSRHSDSIPVNIHTRGGDLSVSFRKEGSRLTDIWLTGPATHVFTGVIDTGSIVMQEAEAIKQRG